MPTFWLIQLQEPVFEGKGGEWHTVWKVDAMSPDVNKDFRTALEYACGKVLDGSDADAFRMVREDWEWRHSKVVVHSALTKEEWEAKQKQFLDTVASLAQYLPKGRVQ